MKLPESTSLSHSIEWWDYRRAPIGEPDPAFPDGRPIDISQNAIPHCIFALPYPARRCGHYVIKCFRCGLAVAATTAGRADDPVSVKVGCLKLDREND